MIDKKIVSKAISLWTLMSFVISVMMPMNASAEFLSTPMMTLPAPGAVSLSAAYQPLMIKGLTVDPQYPFAFDFVVDTGDSGLTSQTMTVEAQKLVKYFLASLAVPEKDMWVNLSPHEKDRVIPESFGKTEMGRDLLAQDYLLKQLTASLMNPESETGKKFWEKIYEVRNSPQPPLYIKRGSAQRGGVTDDTTPTDDAQRTTNDIIESFNKVWIVPADAVVYETSSGAFVAEAKLKVMLESDYLAEQESQGFKVSESQKELSSLNATTLSSPSASIGDPVSFEDKSQNKNGFPIEALGNDSFVKDEQRTTNDIKQIIKDIIIPVIEEEINTGKTFANLRQIYNAQLLATWYKTALKDSVLGQSYVDQAKLKGIDLASAQSKESVYNQYVETFQKGVFDYLKEDYDPATQQIVTRKYFSGGGLPYQAEQIHPVKAGLSENQISEMMDVRGDLAMMHVEMANIAKKSSADSAMIASTPDIQKILDHYTVPYWEFKKQEVEASLKNYPSENQEFLKSLLTPTRYNANKWETLSLKDKSGADISVKVYFSRANFFAPENVLAGKGGIRWVLADDLKNDIDFMKIFRQLNDLGATEDDVRALISIYLKQTAFALAYGMMNKNQANGLPVSGGKGDAFFGFVERGAEGRLEIKDFDNWSNTENKNRISRAYARFLFEKDAVGLHKDIPAPDKNTGGTMEAALDEYLKLMLEKEGTPTPFDVRLMGGQNSYDRLKAELENTKEKHGGEYSLEDQMNYSILKYAVRIFKGEFDGGETQPLPALATFNGISVELGGVEGRSEATGFGVVDAIRAYFEGKIFGKTFSVQGSGNVGQYAALKIVQEGGRVRAISNFYGAVYKIFPEESFSEKEILAIIGSQDRDNLEEVLNHGGFTNVEMVRGLGAANDKVLLMDVDVLIPAATENVLTIDNISQVKARVIAEAANGPVSIEAGKMFMKSGGVILPDNWINSGGVTVSTFHVFQAVLGYQFNENQIRFLRQHNIEETHKKIKMVIQEFKQRKIDLTIGEAFDVVAKRRIIKKSKEVAKSPDVILDSYAEESGSLVYLLMAKGLLPEEDALRHMAQCFEKLRMGGELRIWELKFLKRVVKEQETLLRKSKNRNSLKALKKNLTKYERKQKQLKKVDNAALHPGGIDLTQSRPEIKRDGSGVMFAPVGSVPLNMKIEGLNLLKMTITPMTIQAYQLLTGLDASESDPVQLSQQFSFEQFREPEGVIFPN